MRLITKKENKSTAKSIDAERRKSLTKEKKKKTIIKKTEKRVIKKTTIQTIPYECFVSNHVKLLKTDIKVGNELANIYSKTYRLFDTDYHTLNESQQLEFMSAYMNLLNGFDSTTGLQISIVNNENSETEIQKLLLKKNNDGLDDIRQEMNDIILSKIRDEQKNLSSQLYLTITVIAVDVESANTKFFNLENFANDCLHDIGTTMKVLNADEHIQLFNDILRDPNEEFAKITRTELARRSEKMLFCPDYFEFQRDYFMYDNKYARCLYFRRFPSSIHDNLFKELIDLQLKMITTSNIEFIDPTEAVTLLKKKLTDMKSEEIQKNKRMNNTIGAGIVDPIEGTQLAIDKANAQEFLDDLENRGQKMTLCQFIIMLTADDYNELEQNTEAVTILLRKHQIEPINAPYRQEQAFDSVLPVGNSLSLDKEKNIQTRRTLSSESTAAFMPFNVRKILHSSGLWYGNRENDNSLIFFDKMMQANPSAFIFGIPGSGKSLFAKLEILLSMLSTNDEILIIDPEREYTQLVQFLGGETLTISVNSSSHINPMTLTENPDPSDAEYDPIKAKYQFLLSFFTSICNDKELDPIQKSVIDTVMQRTYAANKNVTLVEYYDEFVKYENEVTDTEIKSVVSLLRETLKLYVHGSLNLFSHEANIDINKRLVSFDISKLDDSIRSLGMMVVMENIWDRVAKNRVKNVATRIYIDEMYLMFRTETSAEFFNELYKRARKWGGLPTGITQNVEEIMASSNAKTMLENSQFAVLMSINQTSRKGIAQIFHMPEETMQYVTNARPGHGIIHTSDFGNIPFGHDFPKDSKIYKIITTKFRE